MIMSIATALPYHILFYCLELVCQPEEHSTLKRDGISWTSNESALPLSLVCVAWYETAQDLLYTSVTLTCTTSTELFLQTAAKKPKQFERVRYLNVGLGEDEETDEASARLSLNLVQVIDLCHNLRHLQISPLHESVSAHCLSVILSKRLVSLVYSPRLRRANVGEIEPSDSSLPDYPSPD